MVLHNKFVHDTLNFARITQMPNSVFKWISEILKFIFVVGAKLCKLEHVLFFFFFFQSVSVISVSSISRIISFRYEEKVRGSYL